ncbi:MAG: hypothetical protein IPL79_16805 [Myxococcales bacterium]|nr:hypothetical protein [Myxococcales bacterium]
MRLRLTSLCGYRLLSVGVVVLAACAPQQTSTPVSAPADALTSDDGGNNHPDAAADAPLAPFHPTRIITINAHAAPRILILSLQGEILDGIDIPAEYWKAEQSAMRGIVEDAAGRIHIFVGTFSPFLLSYHQGQWTRSDHYQWGIPNVTFYGHLAAKNNTVFATSGIGVAKGLATFDLSPGGAQSFVSFRNTSDVTLGLDGNIYAISEDDELYVVTDGEAAAVPHYSPLPDLFTLDESLDIYGVWSQISQVHRLSQGGESSSSPQYALFNAKDIDLAPDGLIVLCAETGFAVTNREFEQIYVKELAMSGFCSFGYH